MMNMTTNPASLAAAALTRTPLPIPAMEVAGFEYDRAVEQYYEPLYRFAFGLFGNASDAADLTQETYQVLLVKGGQIRDGRKLKSWLFTTLYRKFLGQRRHNARFPEVPVETVVWELPTVDSGMDESVDGNAAVAALQTLDEKYRAPLVLFYLQGFSYREIAAVLAVPIGTIMSRLSRGKDQLRQRLEPGMDKPGSVPVPFTVCPPPKGQQPVERTSLFSNAQVPAMAGA